MLTNLINDLLDLAKINALNFKFNNGQRDILLIAKYEAQIQNPKSELYGKIFESQEDISKIFSFVCGD